MDETSYPPLTSFLDRQLQFSDSMLIYGSKKNKIKTLKFSADICQYFLNKKQKVLHFTDNFKSNRLFYYKNLPISSDDFKIISLKDDDIQKSFKNKSFKNYLEDLSKDFRFNAIIIDVDLKEKIDFNNQEKTILHKVRQDISELSANHKFLSIYSVVNSYSKTDHFDPILNLPRDFLAKSESAINLETDSPVSCQIWKNRFGQSNYVTPISGI